MEQKKKEVLAKEHYDIKFLENEKGETGFEVIFKKKPLIPHTKSRIKQVLKEWI
ncbi:hypothetical protein BsIDN1_15310 [Bacillus safensis]|uniref:Uncharacterized protein n=1 Tax=Bacillus safensis TaxID=561879 RepID=A0A5S9M436_BACIA|nr:hypothetical protein BsIDN1_15310 [Bacillus safensis]